MGNTILMENAGKIVDQKLSLVGDWEKRIVILDKHVSMQPKDDLMSMSLLLFN